MYRIIAIWLPSAGAICCYHFRAICPAIILNLSSASRLANVSITLPLPSLSLFPVKLELPSLEKPPCLHISLKDKELFILFSWHTANKNKQKMATTLPETAKPFYYSRHHRDELWFFFMKFGIERRWFETFNAVEDEADSHPIRRRWVWRNCSGGGKSPPSPTSVASLPKLSAWMTTTSKNWKPPCWLRWEFGESRSGLMRLWWALAVSDGRTD